MKATREQRLREVNLAIKTTFKNQVTDTAIENKGRYYVVTLVSRRMRARRLPSCDGPERQIAIQRCINGTLNNAEDRFARYLKNYDRLATDWELDEAAVKASHKQYGIPIR